MVVGPPVIGFGNTATYALSFIGFQETNHDSSSFNYTLRQNQTLSLLEPPAALKPNYSSPTAKVKTLTTMMPVFLSLCA